MLPNANFWRRTLFRLEASNHELRKNARCATFVPNFFAVGAFVGTKGRDMEFINRFIDQPMLHAASRALQIWHERSYRSPEELAPLWNLLVTSCLFMLTCWLFPGQAGLLAAATLLMLSFPHVWALLKRPQRGNYDARAFRSMATLAIKRRETEWAVRLLVLLISGFLPMLVQGVDPDAKLFVLGAGLWFVLTVPASVYLSAAEPPVPRDGNGIVGRTRTMAVG